MTKNAKFILTMRVWSDSDQLTNDPQQRDFSWLENLTGIQLTNAAQASQAIAATSTWNVQMPITNGKYCFIKSDQAIQVRFNGDSSTLNTLNPTLAGTTTDAVMFKKGDFTSLVINNPGTVVANVLVFIGG